MKKQEKGITLIALVITIIILLILAGITLNLVLGENGIISRTKISVETYKKEQVREELQLTITNIQMEYLQKNEEITMEKIVNGLKTSRDLSDTIQNLEIDGTQGIYKGYDFYIKPGSYEVVILEKETNIQMEVSVILEGTKGKQNWYCSDVVASITGNTINGRIAKIRYKINDGEEIEVVGDNAILTVSEEGKNKISYYAVSTNGKKSEVKQEIVKIDKTAPSQVILTKKTVGGDRIQVELSSSDTMSGIEKYDIYVNNIKYAETTESNYTIMGLKGNTEYIIYAITVDQAGNIGTKSESITVKTLNYYINGHITFETVYCDSGNEGAVDDTNCMARLFDDILENDRYGALLMSNYEGYFLEFSVDTKIKIEAYGVKYSDSAGSSINQKAKFSKYNEETNQYEQYQVVDTKNAQWYELITLEPGKYKLQALGVYIRFDEWRQTEV